MINNKIEIYIICKSYYIYLVHLINLKMSYVDDYKSKKESESLKNREICIYSLDEKKFFNFMNKIEYQIVKISGMNLLDFPDQDYMMLYEDNIPIQTVVNMILKSINPFYN